MRALKLNVEQAEAEREEWVRQLDEAEGQLRTERGGSEKMRKASAVTLGRITELQAEIMALEAERPVLKEKVIQAERAAAEARAWIATVEEESARAKVELAGERSGAKKAAAEATEKLAALEKMNTRLKTKLAAEHEEVESARVAMSALRAENALWTHKLSETKRTEATLVATLESVKKENERLKSELAMKGDGGEKAAAEARAQLAALDEKCAGYELALHEERRAGAKGAADAREVIAALKEELAERSTEVNALREQVAAWQGEVEKREDERAVWQNELAEKEEAIRGLREKLAGVEKERAALKGKGKEVVSPGEKHFVAQKRGAPSLVERKLREDLERSERARAALEKQSAELQATGILGSVAPADFVSTLAGRLQRIRQLEADNAATAAEYSHQMRKRRAQQERDVAQRAQDAEREAALLKTVRADMDSAQRERQTLQLQLHSLQKLLFSLHGASAFVPEAERMQLLELASASAAPSPTLPSPASVLTSPMATSSGQRAKSTASKK
ncbi:hypothetical protein KFL_002850170 [Klebsormidium nitens]|uniref:Uncharacterized protein n=1 Tax=Klebsormidium nitens TaxID=105231 RepID=A0A1Y1I774_KLENI|nr:hypothetical protein KFL_002850170 [Klebsormidium nitens]|eukprot:GAQ86373.1 hypothetical protein KFL_002850170 [Klebsormidium nitens]